MKESLVHCIYNKEFSIYIIIIDYMTGFKFIKDNKVCRLYFDRSNYMNFDDEDLVLDDNMINIFLSIINEDTFTWYSYIELVNELSMKLYNLEILSYATPMPNYNNLIIKKKG